MFKNLTCDVIFIKLLLGIIILLSPISLYAGDITLQWDAPLYNAPFCINASGHNPDQVSCEAAGGTWVTDDPLLPVITGYIIYYGTTSGNYSNSIDVNNATSTVISDLASGTWYFAVTAYNEIGNESDYSDELTLNVSSSDITPPVITDVQSTNITTSSASISWITDEASDTRIEYGIDTNYGNTTTLNSSMVTSHIQTVNGLVSSTLYHYRVSSRDSSGNSSISGDYTFNTYSNGGGGTPEITSPAPGNELSGSTVTFNWTAGGMSVDKWWLYIGATVGGSDIHDSSDLGTSTSTTVNGLPTNGSTVYVRLWYETGGSWLYEDYTYTTYSNGGGGTPEITSPAPGNELSGSTVTFNWTAGGMSVDKWWLYIGTTAGGSDIHDSGDLGTSTSTTVNGLPTNGSTVYVRLWYETGGSWLYEDYTYTTYSNGGGGTPEITSPIPGTTLEFSTVEFQWSSGAGVDEYWLGVGTSLVNVDGSSSYGDIYGQSTGRKTLVIIPGISIDGNTLYVRLWYRIGSDWFFIDYTYQTDPSRSALNTSIQAYNRVVDELVTENGISIVPPDFYTYFENNQNEYNDDDLHPNGTGYQSMADLWFLSLNT